MKEYLIYFEIYGKKLKTTVLAHDENEAKYLVKERINFLKIVEVTEEVKNDVFYSDPIVQNLFDIVTGKKK